VLPWGLVVRHLWEVASRIEPTRVGMEDGYQTRRGGGLRRRQGGVKEVGQTFIFYLSAFMASFAVYVTQHNQYTSDIGHRRLLFAGPSH